MTLPAIFLGVKKVSMRILIASLMCAACLAPVLAGKPRGEATAASTRDCPDCPEMVRVPGGTFRMGDESGDGNPDELPVHTVKVPAFFLGKYEITFHEWDACVHAGKCDAEYVLDEGWGRGRRPLINVNWDEAQDYLRWLSKKSGKTYRLPSEAEWEYAARAGTQTPYPWGDEMAAGVGICYSECGEEAEKTAPVGSAKRNAFGLHDLHGNVWEWLQDCWNESYAGAPADGSAWVTGDCSRRVARGGGWLSLSLDLRSAVRAAHPQSIRFHTLGLRVARSP